jgi:hypothetical protein
MRHLPGFASSTARQKARKRLRMIGCFSEPGKSGSQLSMFYLLYSVILVYGAGVTVHRFIQGLLSILWLDSKSTPGLLADTGIDLNLE